MKAIAVESMPKMKPSVRIDSSMLPEIKDWKVGKEYTVVLKVRQTEMEEGHDDKKELSARFEILKATPIDKHMAKKAVDPKDVAKAVKRKVESY